MKKLLPAVLAAASVALSAHAATGDFQAPVRAAGGPCEIAAATGAAPDLSKMSARELADFYRSNKDYGKRRLEIDYSAYSGSDWVVFRGNLCASGAPVPSFPVSFRFGDKRTYSVTGEDGDFSLEIRRSEIRPGGSYRVDVSAGRYSAWSALDGSALLSGSVYDFKIVSPTEMTGAYVLSVVPVKGSAFPAGPMDFGGETVRVPGTFGIQGFPFVILVAAFAGLLAATWAVDRRRRSAEESAEALRTRPR